MDYTDEQIAILQNTPEEGDVVRIDAKAGAGKTSTIIAMCKKWEKDNSFDSVLYLVYNTKMREEAEKKMKKEGLFTFVEVRTIHSLAYEHVGKFYRHKMGGSLYKTAVKNTMHCSWDDAEDIIEELNEFFYSSMSDVNKLSSSAKKYFAMMKDKNNTSVQMTHDCYLKLFHMKMVIEIDYPVVIVDEAQDSNEVTLDIVMNKISGEDTVKVFVGDPHQQIYSFRGSSNIMDMIDPTFDYPLSKSFRFGQNIAALSSYIIGENVRGNMEVADRLHCYGSSLERCVYISRSNARVIERAFELIGTGKKIHFLRGFAEYAEQFMDLYYLHKKEHSKIKSSKIKKFRSVKHYGNYCNNASDMVGKLACSVIEKKGIHEVYRMVKQLSQEKVSAQKADVVLANVHVSKGLEFNSVVLDDDFISMSKIKPGMENYPKIREELNLLYVAVTRAKYNLVLNKDLDNIYKVPHMEAKLEDDSIWV